MDVRYDSVSSYLYWVDFGIGKVMRLRHVDETVLDIELETFTAVVRDNAIVLSWTASPEADAGEFAVEQRAPGRKRFEEIGSAARQTTRPEVGDYIFVTGGDQPPGRHVFRLRHQSPSGDFSYSREIEVDIQLVESYRVEYMYPNPFGTSTRLSFSVADDQHVVVELYDVAGRYRRGLFNARVRANEQTELQVDGAGLESGLYLVRLRGERFAADHKVLVMK